MAGFSRCATAPIFTLTQHFPRCERIQRENQIHRVGSNQPFAALLRNGYFGAKAKLCKARSLSIAVVGPKRSIRHFGFKHAFRPSPKHIP
jgi:hypothetical protein